jgi:NDP-sugar pyrophosphorylase family protein
MSKRAVILAGGQGTRLRPYTIVLPKPLVPVGELPILEIIVRQLARHGFDRLTIAVNHLAEIIEAFFGNGSKWGVRIDYSLEDKPLGTMGPLKLIRDLPEDFLVMNGDVLTDLNYSAFFDYHTERKGVFTISSRQREHQIDYGVLEADGSAQLRGFQEKPVVNYEVSMGIYALNRRVLDWIPDGKAYGFDHLMHDMIKRKAVVNVRRHEGLWLDIGRPEDYASALDVFEGSRNLILGE